MAEAPGVSAIVEWIKARIAQIEEQLRQHRDLNDELERLRDALGRLERGVGARVRGRRARGKRGVASDDGRGEADGDHGGGCDSEAAAARGRGGAARSDARATILEALKDRPKAAGEIAEATGVPRGPRARR